MDEIRARYALPSLDAAYDRYFGAAPPALRPTWLDLRGPLLFAIAESERARLFCLPWSPAHLPKRDAS